MPLPATGAGFDVVAQTATRVDDNGAPSDRLGWAVGVSGTTAVVGSPQGKAFVLTRDGSAWSQPEELQPTNPVADFGYAVAISGDTIIVGGSGEVHVFVRSGATWSEQTTLDGEGTFGQAVDISGNHLPGIVLALIGAVLPAAGTAAARPVRLDVAPVVMQPGTHLIHDALEMPVRLLIFEESNVGGIENRNQCAIGANAHSHVSGKIMPVRAP